jgi:hypothetical protein
VKTAERSYKDFLDAKVFWQNIEAAPAAETAGEDVRVQQDDLFAGEAA